MTKNSEAKRQPTGDYGVGYCRPPASTRFKKGHSGNPRGRPKGAKNFATYFSEILRQKISVREGSEVRRISKVEALLHSVVLKAIKGDPKALSSIIALARLSGQFDRVAEDGFTGGVLVIPDYGLSHEELKAKVLKQQQELQKLPRYVKTFGPPAHISVSGDSEVNGAKR